MASIRRRDPSDPRSPWVVEYTDASGTRRRSTPPSGLRRDAVALRDELLRDIAPTIPPVSRTFGDAIEAYVAEQARRARAGEITRARARETTIAARRWAPLGAVAPGDINRATIQAVIDGFATRLAPVTINHTLSTARLVMDHHLRSIEDPLRNPFRDRFRKPKVETPPRIPSRVQIEMLLRAARSPDAYEKRHVALVRYGALCLALFSTLRRGEICGLRWQDVDLKTGMIWVRHSLSRDDGLKGTKTHAGVRSQAIVPQVLKVLSLLPGTRDPNAFVFTSLRGDPLNPNEFTSAYWPRVCRKARLVRPDGRAMFRFHDMRHAAASLLSADGLSILHVRDAMGHKSVATTLGTYAELFPEDSARTLAARTIAAQFVGGLNG